MRAIEFFSGIGGFRCALSPRHSVVAAFDISVPANRTYAMNFSDAPMVMDLSHVDAALLQKHDADIWMMSPPCQPYCKLGTKKDLDDPRSTALKHLINLIPLLKPRAFVLENVIGFVTSNAHALMVQTLSQQQYHILEYQLCPTQFGIPNKRIRYFCLASLDPLAFATPPQRRLQLLTTYLEPDVPEHFFLTPTELEKHGAGLDIITEQASSTCCFIGGYGRYVTRSGSYLEQGRRIRRFTPTEITRLHQFPDYFQFPPELSLELQYRLIGNSLNVAVAQWILAQIP